MTFQTRFSETSDNSTHIPENAEVEMGQMLLIFCPPTFDLMWVEVRWRSVVHLARAVQCLESFRLPLLRPCPT